MAFSYAAIRQGLADNLAGALSGYQISAYMLSNFTAPAIMVRPDPDTAIEYGQSMGGVVRNVYMQIICYVGATSDIGAQLQLDELIESDAVVDAIESDKTLGGACSDLDVLECRSYQEYSRPDGSTVLGATWSVYVICG